MTTKKSRGIRYQGHLPPQNDNLFRVFCTEEGSPAGEIDLGNSPLRHFVKRKGPVPGNESVFWYEVGTGAKFLYAARKAKKSRDIRDFELSDKVGARTLTSEELSAFLEKVDYSLIKEYRTKKRD